MARGSLKDSYNRQKKSRRTNPDLVQSGVNTKDASLFIKPETEDEKKRPRTMKTSIKKAI